MPQTNADSAPRIWSAVAVSFRPNRVEVLALAVLLLGLGGGLWLYAGRSPADPDRHFHFALARTWAENGMPKTLPQVEGIGWNVAFVDKEFLFHVVTWLGWLVGERAGVIASSALLAALIVSLLYVLARQFLGARESVLAVLAGASCPMFLYRLVLVRPHLLAIAATLLLLVGLTRTSWKVTFAAGLLFALGYHALYIPAAVLGLAFVLQGRSAWRAVGAGVGGLVLGTVINPYFPGTLETTWMTLTIAASKPSGNTFGGELFPIQPHEFFGAYRVPVVMFLTSVVLSLLSRVTSCSRMRFMLVATAGLFWVLCLRSARASEYAIPLTIAAFASVSNSLPPMVLSLGLIVGLVLNVPLLRDSAQVTQLDRYTMHIADAVDALPKEAAGQKVLNCTFPEGEVLLDRRPDVRFVDVLDPTFLERFDKDRHQARLLLINGEARDVRDIVAVTFGAQYVICGYPQAKRLLDDNPDFVRLRPPPGPPLPPGSGPSVYEVRRR